MERILIARAAPMGDRRLAAALASNGYELYEAYDGVTALVATRRKRPEVVFLDVLLPRMDALSVCRAIKKDPALSATRVVLVTASGSDAAVDVGRGAGADVCLVQPISPVALRDVLDQIPQPAQRAAPQ